MPEQLSQLGRLFIFLGLGLAFIGVLLVLAPRLPFIGRLPGDIQHTGPRGRVTVFAPITTMIIISLILTAALNIIIRLFNR